MCLVDFRELVKVFQTEPSSQADLQSHSILHAIVTMVDSVSVSSTQGSFSGLKVAQERLYMFSQRIRFTRY